MGGKSVLSYVYVHGDPYYTVCSLLLGMFEIGSGFGLMCEWMMCS